MTDTWTRRASKRLASASGYIAQNFYPAYATAFRDDVITTVKLACNNPHIGQIAFKNLDRPEIKKLLCKNRKWWVYYRVKKDYIEVLSVKHVLQNVKSQLNL